MHPDIRESDWKLLHQLAPIALDRFCRRALAEIGRLCSDTGEDAHARYLAVFKLIERRDKELADTFNDLRRSTALLQLARMRSQGLLDDEEFARFSEETRNPVLRYLAIVQ